MTVPTIPVLSNPVLLDRVVYEIQLKMAMGFGWLTNAFGIAQKMIGTDSNNRQFVYPGVFAGVHTEDYLNVLPDENLGCYSFVEIQDPVEPYEGNWTMLQARIKVIFWFDLRKIFSNWPDKTNWHVFDLVDKHLRVNSYAYSDIVWDRAYFETDEIFSGYTIREDAFQFMMRPYGGFAIEGDLYTRPDCGQALNINLPGVTNPPVVGLPEYHRILVTSGNEGANFSLPTGFLPDPSTPIDVLATYFFIARGTDLLDLGSPGVSWVGDVITFDPALVAGETLQFWKYAQ